MKTITRSCVLMLAGFLVILCAAPQAMAVDAKAMVCVGNVEVRKPGDKDWKPLTDGTALPQGTQVLTHPGSTCSIKLGDSAIELGPDTFATMTNLEPIKVDMQSGRIYALVRNLRPGSEFKVASPTAVCAARGTGWVQTTNDVACYEGTLLVQGADGSEAEIPEGYSIQTNTSGLGDTAELTDAQMQQGLSQGANLAEQTGAGQGGAESTADPLKEQTTEEEAQESARDVQGNNEISPSR